MRVRKVSVRLCPENSKLEDLDLSFAIFLAFMTLLPTYLSELKTQKSFQVLSLILMRFKLFLKMITMILDSIPYIGDGVFGDSSGSDSVWSSPCR